MISIAHSIVFTIIVIMIIIILILMIVIIAMNAMIILFVLCDSTCYMSLYVLVYYIGSLTASYSTRRKKLSISCLQSTQRISDFLIKKNT